jgi:hypothetical protein
LARAADDIDRYLNAMRGTGWKRLLAVVCVLASAVVVVSGCGESSDSGAGELARQQELRAARHEAAQDARQNAKIEDLERQLRRDRRDSSTLSASTSEQEESTSGNEVGDWPGGSAYTAILASLESQVDARAFQQQATASGLDAGVLYSSAFSSLRPGYWVVFSGSFTSESEAADRAKRAQDLGISDAYPRFVAP